MHVPGITAVFAGVLFATAAWAQAPDILPFHATETTLANGLKVIRRHLSARDLSVVIVTKDAARLKQALTADAISSIAYDGEKPKSLLDEDRAIGALRLNIAPARVAVTPIADVFAH